MVNCLFVECWNKILLYSVFRLKLTNQRAQAVQDRDFAVLSFVHKWMSASRETVRVLLCLSSMGREDMVKIEMIA